MNESSPAMILRIAVPSPLYQCFDYLLPENFPTTQIAQLRPGLRVFVPFGRREVVGVLIQLADKAEVATAQLRHAIVVVDEEPLLNERWLKLMHWASAYYQYPIGEAILGVLPKAMRQGKPFKPTKTLKEKSVMIESALALNAEQQLAVNSVLAADGFSCFLLEGITGSGKTEVYLQIIAELLKQNKQALVLVPEIALTPQTLSRFERRFAHTEVVAYHSGLTDKGRMEAWQLVSEGKAGVVVGTRSALFLPWQNPGIIILDEEHDLSFKQQSGFRYSARDLAVVRGQFEQVPVLLGSATPSLESLYNVQRARYQHLKLSVRAGEARPPHLHLINLCNQSLQGGLTQELIRTMESHLKRDQQVLLFLNRRGYAPVLMCHQCGWMANCDRCDAKLILHHNPRRLRCHHCDAIRMVPSQCGQCQSEDLLQVGHGTEQLQQVVGELLPNYPVIRIDRDSTRAKGSMQALLAEAQQAKAAILIGTQMLAKGHHFPALSMVAIVDADGGLFSSDFRALERMGQLLVQVSGRAGREQTLGEVCIQTHHPDHPLLQLLLAHGYPAFAEALLIERAQAELPPFSHMALLRAEATQASRPMQFLETVKGLIKNPEIKALGPIAALMERKAGKYRAQLLFQAQHRGQLQHTLQQLTQYLAQSKLSRSVRWTIDVDPQENF